MTEQEEHEVYERCYVCCKAVYQTPGARNMKRACNRCWEEARNPRNGETKHLVMPPIPAGDLGMDDYDF